MKRDMDLVRKILLAIEESEDPFFSSSLQIDGYTDKEIGYHVRIMVDGGLVDAKDSSTFQGEDFLIHGLTWQGHEFLDAARNDTVWNEVKNNLKGQFYTLPFAVVKDLLVAYIKTKYLTGNN